MMADVGQCDNRHAAVVPEVSPQHQTHGLLHLSTHPLSCRLQVLFQVSAANTSKLIPIPEPVTADVGQ